MEYGKISAVESNLCFDGKRPCFGVPVDIRQQPSVVGTCFLCCAFQRAKAKQRTECSASTSSGFVAVPHLR